MRIVMQNVLLCERKARPSRSKVGCVLLLRFKQSSTVVRCHCCYAAVAAVRAIRCWAATLGAKVINVDTLPLERMSQA